MEPRLLLFHKQAVSARVRFLRFPHGGGCGPDPLPDLVQMADAVTPGGDDTVVAHPGLLVARVARDLGLTDTDLEADGVPLARLDAPGSPITVFTVRLLTTDPPFEAAEAMGAGFIEMTQARVLEPMERELLRRIYERALG